MAAASGRATCCCTAARRWSCSRCWDWRLGTDWRAKTLALLLWLVPLGLVIALGLRSGLFELRYLVVSLPGLTLLAALGIARLARHPVPAVALGTGRACACRDGPVAAILRSGLTA